MIESVSESFICFVYVEDSNNITGFATEISFSKITATATPRFNSVAC